MVIILNNGSIASTYFSGERQKYSKYLSRLHFEIMQNNGLIFVASFNDFTHINININII